MKTDVYSDITDKVLALMEQHGTDWVRPFKVNGTPTNVASKKAYRGINVLLLGWSHHPSNVWGTYKQWAERETPVMKGQKGTQIVFWKFIQSREDENKTIPILKTYTVFNAAQCEGYQEEEAVAFDGIAAAEDFFRRIPAKVQHGSKRGAYYSPAIDTVCMPDRGDFVATATSTAEECYYSTLAHELVHWTSHKDRCDRTLTREVEGYAREELVAEIGATIICSILGVSPEPRPDHAQYLNGWMRKLQDHKREFVSAASAATKAVAFLEAFNQIEERIAA